MRVIIAGPRYRSHKLEFDDYESVKRAIFLSGFSIMTVISGCALGVDQLGERWANENHIHIEYFPVTNMHYNKYGRRAPFLRNVSMAERGEALIAVWDGVSKGTGHMIQIARKKKLKIFIYRTDLKKGNFDDLNKEPEQQSLF